MEQYDKQGDMIRFDPLTGQPIDPNAAPPVRYDPETGVPVYASEKAPVRSRPVCEKRDAILAVLLAVVCIFLSDAILFAGLGLGGSIGLTLLLVLTVCYLWRSRSRLTLYGSFCAFGVLALAVSMAFSDDGYLKFLAFLFCLMLSTILLLELMRQRNYASGSIYAVADLSAMVFARPFGGLADSLYALFHTRNPDGSVRKRRIGGILVGVGCAIPALGIVIPLLISSDAAFAGMIRSFHIESLGFHIFAAIVGLLAAMLLFSQLFSLPADEKDPPQREPKSGWLDPAIPISFLAVLGLVYLLYLISQAAYFFDGFRGLLPDGYTVAEYARRGFFEMSTLCILNLGFVFLALLLCKKKSDSFPFVLRLLALFVCLFSLLLIATSISKMVLYIHSFGMTRLRILTSAFMLWLAIVFLAVILRMFVRKTPYLKVAVIAAVLIIAVLNFANVDRIVAGYNVRAYQDGRLEQIDMDMLRSLSDASVPYLVELLDDADEKVADSAQMQLQRRAALLFEINPRNGQLLSTAYDLRGFNLVENQARRLILENYDRIYP